MNFAGNNHLEDGRVSSLLVPGAGGNLSQNNNAPRLTFMPNRGTIVNRPTLGTALGSQMGSKHMQISRQSMAPSNFMMGDRQEHPSFENLDFSKPEKFNREIYEFLSQYVNFETDEGVSSPGNRNPLYKSNRSPNDRNHEPSNLSFVKKGGKFSNLNGTDA